MLRIFLLLLCFAAAPVVAQSSGVLVATADEAGSYLDTTQFVWLDNDTLIFEPTRSPGKVDAYEYHVSTGEVSHLDLSPLYFEPTPKRVEHYQIATDETGYSPDSFRSPFEFSSSLTYPLHRVLYLSSLHIACGFECPSGIVMQGIHDDQADYTVAELRAQTGTAPLDYLVSRTYRPLNLKASYGLGVLWARNSDAAVIEVSYVVGDGSRIYYASLVDRPYGEYPPEIYIGDVNPFWGQHIYALSEDGTRVIYGEYQYENASHEALRVWQVIPAVGDAIWSAQVLPSVSVQPQSSAEDAFAGANFIPGDEGHILALHADGILRIDLITDERTVLNPDITATSFSLGVFSPDNRHVAVVTPEYEVRVMPTGIE